MAAHLISVRQSVSSELRAHRRAAELAGRQAAGLGRHNILESEYILLVVLNSPINRFSVKHRPVQSSALRSSPSLPALIDLIECLS